MELFCCEGITSRAQAYGLLYLAVSRHWGLPFPPSIRRTAQGKPEFSHYPQFRFNLSHSGSVAVCVLDDCSAGVDVEHLRPHHPRLPQRICSPEELDWLNAQPDFHRALCRLWTLKESCVKYNGTGLTVPIRSICVPLMPSGLKCTQHNGLTFFTLDTMDWTVSVCGHSAPKHVTYVPVDQLPAVSKPSLAVP